LRFCCYFIALFSFIALLFLFYCSFVLVLSLFCFCFIALSLLFYCAFVVVLLRFVFILLLFCFCFIGLLLYYYSFAFSFIVLSLCYCSFVVVLLRFCCFIALLLLFYFSFVVVLLSFCCLLQVIQIPDILAFPFPVYTDTADGDFGCSLFLIGVFLYVGLIVVKTDRNM
jgi:hypothetical protein